MLRQIAAPFRSEGSQGVNLQDNVLISTINTSVYTKGCTLIDAINPLSLEQDWKIIALAVQANLGFFTSNGGGGQFGKIGKVVVGLLPFGEQPPTNGSSAGIPFVSPMTALPSLLTATLWDPDNDEPPPFTTLIQGIAPNQVKALYAQITPPVPLAVRLDQTVCIGMWALPSLWSMNSGVGNSVAVEVFNSSYVLYCDDGT